MMTQFRCDDKELLVAYLYGEVGDADRAAVAAHLASCQACAGEIADLGAVRMDLAQWEPPETELGFRIMRTPVPVASRPWWRPPVWAPMALAAGLLLAVGAALANVEVQARDGGVTIRAGWAHPPLAAPAPVQARSTPPEEAVVTPVRTGMSEAEVHQALSNLESRLRAELASSAKPASPVPVTLASSSTTVDRGQVLQQVRSLVDESERRQQRELALRIAQVVQDFDNQRRTDLVHIEQGFGQIESLTGQEAARQRAITNYLVRASQRQ